MLWYLNVDVNFLILNLLYFSSLGLCAIFDIIVYICLKTFRDISKLSISANKIDKLLCTIFCKESFGVIFILLFILLFVLFLLFKKLLRMLLF